MSVRSAAFQPLLVEILKVMFTRLQMASTPKFIKYVLRTLAGCLYVCPYN